MGIGFGWVGLGLLFIVPFPMEGRGEKSRARIGKGGEGSSFG